MNITCNIFYQFCFLTSKTVLSNGVRRLKLTSADGFGGQSGHSALVQKEMTAFLHGYSPACVSVCIAVYVIMHVYS